METLIKIVARIIKQLDSNTAWRGIIQILMAVGMVVFPRHAMWILAVGLLLLGLINLLRTATVSMTDLEFVVLDLNNKLINKKDK
jgi:hypothetical protein